jgi:HNH endonuclease
MVPYITVLYQIVAAGQKTNSYKFALWRALASLAPTTNAGNPQLSKRDLSPLFLEYYWPLDVTYHLRQGIDPDKDPIVMKRIRQLMEAGTITHGETLRHFEKRAPSEYKVLYEKVAREAFDEVIPRFHRVRGAAIAPQIFTHTGTEGNAGEVVKLTDGGRQFLMEYKALINYIAISGWVRFTEQFTSAPRLHDKIDGTNLQRGALSRWRASLMAIQQGKCFYDESHEMSLSEVDHVLPWSFVLEDMTWNLVLACRKCNNDKRDRLTDIVTLRRLCARNEQIAEGYINADRSFLRHFTEWRSRNLSTHIEGLYDQAAADGFPRWK